MHRSNTADVLSDLRNGDRGELQCFSILTVQSKSLRQFVSYLHGLPAHQDRARRAEERGRRVEKQETEGDQTVDEWGDLDEFSARGSEPTLRRLDEDGAASGIPGRKRR